MQSSARRTASTTWSAPWSKVRGAWYVVTNTARLLGDMRARRRRHAGPSARARRRPRATGRDAIAGCDRIRHRGACPRNGNAWSCGKDTRGRVVRTGQFTRHAQSRLLPRRPHDSRRSSRTESAAVMPRRAPPSDGRGTALPLLRPSGVELAQWQHHVRRVTTPWRGIAHVPYRPFSDGCRTLTPPPPAPGSTCCCTAALSRRLHR